MKTLVKLVFSAAVVVAVLSGCAKNDEATLAKNQSGRGQGDSALASGLGEDSAFPGHNAGVADASGVKNNTIYFGFDRSTIESQYRHIIEANANYLKSHPNAKIRLEGHTDPRGSREYNVGLGQRRADQVANQLNALGVPHHEMVIVSYGKEKLASQGSSEDDYHLDRRVEMIYEAG